MEKDNEALIKEVLALPPAPVGRGRRVAEVGLLALLGVSVAALLLGFVAYVVSEVAALALLILGVGVWLFHRAFLRADAQDRLVTLQKQLRAHMEARGIADGDTSALALRERAAFWQEAQTSALLDLRQRRDTLLAAPPTRTFDLVTPELRRFYLFVAAIWAIVTLILSSDAGPSQTYAAGECLFISAFFYGVWTVLALAGINVTRSLGANNARAALDHEIRHVADLIDAAGGLSLAEHEVESTLRGALSGDVALGGELEEVKS